MGTSLVRIRNGKKGQCGCSMSGGRGGNEVSEVDVASSHRALRLDY